MLAAEHPRLVHSVGVISAKSIPAPLLGPTLALVRLAAPLPRNTWFASAQARRLGVPRNFLEDYRRDSAATTCGTLVVSVGENIGFMLPHGWSAYTKEATVLVGAKERVLMHRLAKLTARALPGGTLRIVQGAGHDISLSRPVIMSSVVNHHIMGSADDPAG